MKKIDYDFLDQIKMPGRLKVSPEGDKLAFILSQSDYDQNSYKSNLYLYAEGGCRQLTFDDKLRDFAWCDNDSLIFSAARSAEDIKEAKEDLAYSAFYRLSLQGGEAAKIFSLALAVQDIVALGNDYYLLEAAYQREVPNAYILDSDKRKSLKKQKEDQSYFTYLDEIPFYRNGSDYTQGQRTGLFLYNAKIQQIERISKENLDLSFYSLSEDKRRLYYAAHDYKERYQLYNALYKVELPLAQVLAEGEEMPILTSQELYPEKDYNFNYVWEADGRLLVLASDMQSYGMNESSDVFAYLPEDKELQLLSENDHELWSSLNCDTAYLEGPCNFVHEGVYYFVSTEREHDAIFAITSDGLIQKLYDADGKILALQKFGTGFASFMMRDYLPGELYSLQSAASEYKLKALSNWHAELLKEYELNRPVKVLSGKEQDIDGWVIYPVDYAKGQAYPAILDIHGGPRTAYGAVFNHEMQLWAQKGYFVLFANPHGSSGRGDEFADIRGKYGSIDYEDLMNFVDVCLTECPDIDRQRLGVTGGSYGGFMTNWIIGHTDRFAAAATQRSISNWISFYGTSDIGYTFACDQIGSDTYDQAGFLKLWEFSPLRYINGCSTPTLVIHADKDYRCPLEQGMQIFTALKDREIPSEMYIFHEETHELSRSGKPKGRRQRLKAITEWMNKYLEQSRENMPETAE